MANTQAPKITNGTSIPASAGTVEVTADNATLQVPATPISTAVIIPITTKVALAKLVEGWNKDSARAAVEASEFAISKLQESQENLMAVGDQFNKLSELLEPTQFTQTLKTLTELKISGLSSGNLRLWMNRAKILRSTVRNPLVRQSIALLAGGSGIVVRIEPTEDERKAGKGTSYEISPFFKQAFNEAGPIPETKRQDEAEVYARRVVSKANELRSNARKPHKGRETKAFKARFAKYNKQWKVEASCTMLFDMVKALVQDTEDLTPIGNLIKHLNELKIVDVRPASTATAKVA